MIDATIHPDLVYDLGAHNGDDTAFYLSQGYRVVAVEPTPSLALRLKQRFATAIQDGRVYVLNAAITDANTEKADFYISRSDYQSSLIKDISARESVIMDTIEVPARMLVSLFREFGVPRYCKMDIEGYDARVINTISSDSGWPPYLSCEACCDNINEVNSNEERLYLTLDAMRSAGYTAFKIVDQEHFAILGETEHFSYLHSLPGRIKAKLRALAGRPLPTTAPFGEQLPGDWKDYATTKKYLTHHFREYFRLTQNKEKIFWVDLHAKWVTE